MKKRVGTMFLVMALSLTAIVPVFAQEMEIETDETPEEFVEEVAEEAFEMSETEEDILDSEEIEVLEVADESEEDMDVEAMLVDEMADEDTEAVVSEVEDAENRDADVTKQQMSAPPEEKNFYITSEVSPDAGEGDIFHMECILNGYEEGTYTIQWQYRTIDWFGNYTSDWIDEPGAEGEELEVIINEENALKAWRVVVNEVSR